ncbi:hypothetical protein ASPCAL07956 [Aspergillus calidoustus]|uniref:AAA+ ATPase domain-containing protein n=1 Tax=Aspergillus calidoustus TaxID=454130 RepID=A0A0U5GVS4_ASPCI|nr:hypothetical protein ASPCAL07956 [Aspergillus calidoustus]
MPPRSNRDALFFHEISRPSYKTRYRERAPLGDGPLRPVSPVSSRSNEERNDFLPLSGPSGISRDETSAKASRPEVESATVLASPAMENDRQASVSTSLPVYGVRVTKESRIPLEENSSSFSERSGDEYSGSSFRESPREMSHRGRRQRLLMDSQSVEVDVDQLLLDVEALRAENERLRSGSGPWLGDAPAPLSYRPQVFYCLNKENYFLDEPHWEAGDYRPVLRSTNPIRNIDYYIDQHPEIAFYIIKRYSSVVPEDPSVLERSDGVFRTAIPEEQTLTLVASAMINAVEDFVQNVPGFKFFFPEFDPRAKIQSPYLFIFYSIPSMGDARSKLDAQGQKLFDLLYKCIDSSHGLEYASARKYESEGLTSSRLLQYLIKPGDVLVNLAGPNTQAYVALDWARPLFAMEGDYEAALAYMKEEGTSNPDSKSHHSKRLTYSWTVPVAHWSFDGNFERTETSLLLTMSVEYESETVPIKYLDYVPLNHTPSDIPGLLERRGITFWSLRFRKYVTYKEPSNDGLDNTEDRYMVDIRTYKKLQPGSKLNKKHLRADLDQREMANDEPPRGYHLLLFPPVIPGYNLLRKYWADLYVDYIYDIDWNKQAFRDLVVDEEIKELVQALVTKQIASRKSTDSISGKGNGLILLLHGAPGTGKTFTAEGVAEFAEKPLFRVTCGDVGTEATAVDQYLQAAFRLGKLWDCVVLLDEADVFLEERDVRDLNRNALVSVFLRALEYYDGILILTSNRVGTFDEAFKSRIQLSLHYENLTYPQRRKIWRNFMNRLKTVDTDNVDFDDILDHLDELGREDINGREIRNAITIARQLAQFKGEKFQYRHLSRAIRVSGKFGKYLKDLRDGLTEDHIKHDLGVRHSYQIQRSNSL